MVRTAVRQAMRILAGQFVLAETIEGAVQRAAERRPYRFSFDMLGEAARTAELLPRLCEEGYLLGLTTGGVETAAHIKLERGHLNRYFHFGGYGSDSKDRVELTRKALDRASTILAHLQLPAEGMDGRGLGERRAQ